MHLYLPYGGTTFTDSYDYHAFGDFYAPPTSMMTKFAYTGQQYDDDTGLYFLRARYYDPAIGRFLSQDPYPVNTGNPVELNRYVYTANNPVNLSDPSGLMAFFEYSSTTANSGKQAQGFGPVGLWARAVFAKIAAALAFIVRAVGPLGTTLGAMAGAAASAAMTALRAAAALGLALSPLVGINGTKEAIEGPAQIQDDGLNYDDTYDNTAEITNDVTANEHVESSGYNDGNGGNNGDDGGDGNGNGNDDFPPQGPGGKGTVSEIGNLNGFSRELVENYLRNHPNLSDWRETAGGYKRFIFNDQSEIWIRHTGEVVRIPLRSYTADNKLRSWMRYEITTNEEYPSKVLHELQKTGQLPQEFVEP